MKSIRYQLIQSLFFLCLLWGVTSQDALAQIEDHSIWASVKAIKKIDNGWTFAAAPILRLNNNISDYQNWSIDLSGRKSLNQNWAVQLLSRTWFLPNDNDDRQFIWLDVAYAKQLGNFKVGSYLRYHHALDLHDRPDADFIRWKTSLHFTKSKVVQPYLAVEPWFRLNGFGEFQLARYEPGVLIRPNDRMNILARYWHQQTYNVQPDVLIHIYVITLGFTI